MDALTLLAHLRHHRCPTQAAAALAHRAGRWQRVVLLPVGDLPAGAAPADDHSLAGCCPCGWPPLAGGALAASSRPLQPAWPWVASPTWGLAVASRPSMGGWSWLAAPPPRGLRC
ncbi:hypothetical protein BHE74_00054614 [Ensete ventricosum]|nr:hypothetical protein BHE74_00054614 [Ensete ventricosum]